MSATEPRTAAARTRPRALLTAFTLMTCIPFPARWQAGIGAADVSAAARWYPLVGVLIGGLAGAVLAGATAAGEPLLGAAAATVALFAITGALHLDGLADSFDAIGVRGGRERKLEVMRGSTIGAYGAAALASWLLLTTAALHGIAAGEWHDAPARIAGTVVFASVTGRAVGVVHGMRLAPARRDGLGVGLTVTAGNGAIAWLTVLAAGGALVAGGLLPAEAALAGVAAGLLAGRGVDRQAGRILGGRTGDTLGAATILAELAVLCAVALVA